MTDDGVRTESYINEAGQPCYRTIGPNGTLEVENARVTDQLFAHGEVGVVNVTMIKEATRGAQPRRLPINDALLAQVSANDPSEETIRAMTPQRMREPVLFVEIGGILRLVDGTHRIIKRNRNRMTWVKAFVFIDAAVAAFQSPHFVIDPQGERRPFQVGEYFGLG